MKMRCNDQLRFRGDFYQQISQHLHSYGCIPSSGFSMQMSSGGIRVQKYRQDGTGT